MPRTEARGLVVLAAAAQIDGNGEQWIEVIPTATEARNGPFFFTVTDDDLTTYARSIAAQPGLIPVDYDHTEGTGTIAAGWFTGETQVVEAGGMNPLGDDQAHASLWAKVKWTPKAAQEINDGHYKRLSPEFTFQQKDTKTGLMTKAKAIIASTLTNRPFFRELAPVGSEGDVIWDRTAGYTSLREKLSAELNPGDSWHYCVLDIDVVNLRALVEDTREATTYVVTFTRSDDGSIDVAPSSDWVEAEQEWVSAARQAEATHTEGVKPLHTKGVTSMKEELKPVAAALGLADDATDEQVLAAVTATKKSADEKPEPAGDGVVLTQAEVDDLKARAKKSDEIEQELAEERVTAMLDTAERTGRTLPAQRESLVAQCKTGEAFDKDKIAAVRAFIDATPEKAFLATARGTGGDGEAADALDAVATAEAKKFEAEDPIDQESLKVHARTLEILDGKKNPTEDEYLAAAEQARDELHVTA